jgi:glycosyltransferase involved in cell wall biosynthesis
MITKNNCGYKNKILYFSDCHIYGGGDRNIINIANHMAEQPGTQVFFAYRYFKMYQRGVERDLSPKVKAVSLSLLSNDTFFHRVNLISAKRLIKKLIKMPFWLLQKIGLYTAFNYLTLRNIVDRIKPDLIHVNNGGYPASFNCQIAIFAAVHSGVDKIVYHINNPAQKQGALLDKVIDKKINRHVNFFITASRQALESLTQKRFFDIQKLVQVYNTVENSSISKSKQEICRIHHIPADKFILSEVAFLSERKGQIYILKAFSKIKELHPDIFSRLQLFLVGDGEDYEKLKQYCEKKSLFNVIFTGYRADYIDYIACSDIFLLPSIGGEDMPLAVLSAMNLGKPIIAGEVAGIAEEIEHLKSGVLLRVAEMEKLYLEIINLFNYPDLQNYYAENAKRRFDAYFSQKVVYDKIIALYSSLGINEKQTLRAESS